MTSGGLAAFADYRVRLASRRWLWEGGELVGMKLRAITERARASSQAAPAMEAVRSGAEHDRPPATSHSSPRPIMEAAGSGAEHELTFRLHRHVRYGLSAGDRLSLTTSTRLPHAAAQEAEDDPTQPLAIAGSRLG
jgi:hypothetical protein